MRTTVACVGTVAAALFVVGVGIYSTFGTHVAHDRED